MIKRGVGGIRVSSKFIKFHQFISSSLLSSNVNFKKKVFDPNAKFLTQLVSKLKCFEPNVNLETEHWLCKSEATNYLDSH